MSGTAPGLPTKFELTLHIALKQVSTAMDVVFGQLQDAQESDIRK